MTDETNGTITRRRLFAQVPDELISDRNVTDFALRLWCRLDRHAGQDGRAFPHIATLAEEMGTSERKINYGISNLVQTGWITRKRRGFSNVIDTTLNDTRVRIAGETSSSETSVQVTSETQNPARPVTQDFALPVTQDPAFPKKESPSKESPSNLFASNADASSDSGDDGTLPFDASAAKRQRHAAKTPAESKRPTRCPENYLPPRRVWDEMHAACPHVDLNLETQNFIDYWLGKSGPNSTKIDWDRTWRVWIRNAHKQAMNRRPMQHASSGPNYDQWRTR